MNEVSLPRCGGRSAPDCDIDVVPNVARKSTVRAALSNSIAFGGHNVSLAFRRHS